LASTQQGSFVREERVLTSDTVGALLGRLGVEDRGAIDFIRSNPIAAEFGRQLRPGKTVSATTGPDGTLQRLLFPLNGNDQYLVLERDTAGSLVARSEKIATETTVSYKGGEIHSSLFAAADAAEIPDAVAVQLAEIFGGDIDFHRDLQKGDRFFVAYETIRARGQTLRSGRILAAEFEHGGRRLQAIQFVGADGQSGYYDQNGKSLRKAFLRSPLEFSRVTSGFTGSRFHPVLKEWRAHRGVDYGAPIGTRVRATSDGVVEFVGRQNGYGNLIVLRHNGSYSTAYGHLNGFVSGLRRGMRVAQGELIGYVGRTGLASGPHLHYEFRINNQQVNPLAVALPDARPLDRSALAQFRPQADTAMGSLALARHYVPGGIE
jgi:murein DD-endopeptidase MepM/ murein hydrolase activator NlpD